MILNLDDILSPSEYLTKSDIFMIFVFKNWKQLEFHAESLDSIIKRAVGAKLNIIHTA